MRVLIARNGSSQKRAEELGATVRIEKNVQCETRGHPAVHAKTRQKLSQATRGLSRTAAGFALPEVIVAISVLGIMMVSLYGGLSAGFGLVRLARENLRATQIMVQRTEDYRLYGWSQLTNSSVVAPTFIDYFDPAGKNSQSAGAVYLGVVSNSIPDNVPAAYRNNMRTLTVTVFWTNYPSKPSTNLIVHSRQMQTLVARYGMQNYVSK